MKNQYCELNELGWDDWFAQRAQCESTDTVARVAAVDRDQLLLVDRIGQFRAKLAGSYLHRHHLSHELPCVGDWVCIEKQPGDDFGVISTHSSSAEPRYAESLLGTASSTR